MKIPFSKYHGAGNDFVLIDNRNNTYNLDNEQIAFICNRRVGVGADGLMLLNNSQSYDFQMVYFNSDGGMASMCGNGGRCITAFAHDLGIVSNKTTFEATDGLHTAEIKNWNGTKGEIKLGMKDVQNIENQLNGFILNTGVPHFVLEVNEISNIDVKNLGRTFRFHKAFKPDGCNVNFIQWKENKLFVRTYERGVEDETLSCGTGVTASALVWNFKNRFETNFVNVKTLGGDFCVSFEKLDNGYKSIFLQGPVAKSFEGIFHL